jgi:hypothetical protein
MANEHPRLKLGKRAAFVKTHLKRLPQQEETWEVDFRALPKPAEQADTHYLGLVVALPVGDPLVYLPVEYTPTVNDLADLLADAMRRPLIGSARRPAHMHFGANPRWDELFPHLKELGIEITVKDELPELEEVCLDFLREMRKARPGPIIMLSPRPTGSDVGIDNGRNDDSRAILLRLGQAQIDGMFARQEEGPAIDDSEFLPLVEIVLTAFEKTQADDTLAEELWEYAFGVYDRMCKEADPSSTAAENRELMRSYLLGKRRATRRRR